MEAIKDVFLVLTPEVAVLMPVSCFLLRILQSSIELNVPNSGNLFIFLILIVKTEEFWEFDDLIPDFFGKLDHLFFIEIDIFDANTSVVVKGTHDFFFIWDKFLELSGGEDEREANLAFWGLNFIHGECCLN